MAAAAPRLVGCAAGLPSLLRHSLSGSLSRRSVGDLSLSRASVFLSGQQVLGKAAGSPAPANRSYCAGVKAMAGIQLYSLATPNGQKIGIALEELGVPYEAHLIDISKGDQFSPEFVKINPNSKIPAIVDPEGPGGKPLNVFESGAILLYLAEKYGKLLPADPAEKWVAIQWLFFQVGGVGPMMGQLGHFKSLSKEKMDHPYPLERYLTEVKRLFKVVDGHLEGREYLASEYSVADISLAPWMNGGRTRMTDVLDMAEYPNVAAWLDRVYARPAVQKGITVNAK